MLTESEELELLELENENAAASSKPTQSNYLETEKPSLAARAQAPMAALRRPFTDIASPLDNPITNRVRFMAQDVGRSVESVTGSNLVGERIATSPTLTKAITPYGAAAAGTAASMAVEPLPYFFEPENMISAVGG